MISLAIASAALGQGASLPPLPPLPQEFRGAWVATVDNIDWPSRKGMSTAEARAELLRMIEGAAGARLNALLFQVRPMADALYASPYEPWSEFLTGQQGRAPNPAWDPLKFAIEECHKRGIELHAWFNPYRAWHSRALGPVHRRHVSRAHPELVRTYGKQKWMDPGDPRVQQYTLRVMLDVVRRYDLDGVHIDDYFYPYPIKGQAFPDSATYRRHGRGLSKADWRRKNVDDFVERLYRDVHRVKPWVKVGISPFGVYRPGIPRGIEAGLDQYADLYADPRKWLRRGWLDYVSPQLYWAVDPPAQSYPVLLRWWVAENVMARHVWPGNAAYKIVEGPKWAPQEIVDQIEATRETEGATGNVFFSVKYITRNTRGLGDLLTGAAYPAHAFVPNSPWLAKDAPLAPRVVRSQVLGGRTWELEWAPEDPGHRWYAVTSVRGNRWEPWRMRREGRLSVPLGLRASGRVAIVTLDRAGNASPPLFVDVSPVSPSARGSSARGRAPARQAAVAR